MKENKNLCFYQRSIPKYRESFFNDLGRKLSEKKIILTILVDCPKKEIKNQKNINFKIVKALSLKSFQLIRNSNWIILEANHKNLISYLYISYSYLVKTKVIGYCHFISSSTKKISRIKRILRKIYLTL